MFQYAAEEDCLIIPTAETVKQTFFLNLALTKGLPLGMIGPSGTGKSFITNSFVRRLSKERFVTNVINFSARTNVNYTQEVIMSKLDRRRKGVFGPAMGKKCIIFIDDIDLPQQDASGSIPPVELLRQVGISIFVVVAVVIAIVIVVVFVGGGSKRVLASILQNTIQVK